MKSQTMAELAWTGPPIAPVRVPIYRPHLQGNGTMYLLARKAKGTDQYTEFASMAGMFLDPSRDDVTWIADRKDPRVTRLLPMQRRGALALFARHPKVFERCDLVSIETLERIEKGQ